eukprot:COSAG02_NODE_24727_length_679_cov_1.068966_1_plen_47_part_10
MIPGASGARLSITPTVNQQIGVDYSSHEFLPEGEPGCGFGQYEGCQA